MKVPNIIPLRKHLGICNFGTVAPLLVLSCLAMSCAGATAQSNSPEILWIRANGLKLKAQVYPGEHLSAHPTLIVVLHGDLLGVREVPRSTYHYVFAKNAAARLQDCVVVALLRPGYRDDTGQRSEGEQGMTTGDNYTPEVVDAIADAVTQLKQRVHAAHAILVGHSGGAAITGDLLGRWPDAVDGALMVSCPCDLAKWRKHMQQMQGNAPIWSAPVKSISPMDVVGEIRRSVAIRLLVGGDDPVAPPVLSQEYADALRKNGHPAELTIAPGLQHDILLEPVTLDSLTTLVASLRVKPE